MGISVRSFSAQLEVPDSNTRNYLDKGTKLNIEYLEKIARHFSNINISWLITGEGEPFTGEGTASPPMSTQIKKNSQSPIIGTNKAPINYNIEDCKSHLEKALDEVESLRQQLARADALVAAKDETISLLRASYRTPN